MPRRRFFAFHHILFMALTCLVGVPIAQAQGATPRMPEAAIDSRDADHPREREAWFYRGRIVAGKPSAELRRRAYHAKMQMRAQRAFQAGSGWAGQAASSTTWTPLGPVPLASDASGAGVQDYRQVAGRATAVAIDPADPSGNTVYVGGAQAGVWKSTNAASSPASGVTWKPVTDGQATLSVGSIAIQPGSDVNKSVILVGTGEANNSADSYFGLGILRSADAGNSWTLISTANAGALSFAGLGGTRMAFSTANGQTSTVVAAMATTSEGVAEGKVSTNTTRGLYTSLDSGQTWTYNVLADPGGATDATSATSVVYNLKAGLFFAAVRYHGFYSSPDGTHWTRLVNQPGGSALSPTACPPQSTANSQACPIYRGEMTVVPERNEMYAWYVSLDSSGNVVDQFIWQSTDGGATWTQVNDSGITNCGDMLGCGVDQGYYNLELQAVPNGSTATDLYAGAINLYKCSISSINPGCNSSGFMNLTHVYGCIPIAAPAHVHPDQHALAYMILASLTDLMYFANDGGIYRTLDGFTGLYSGNCAATNQFDDLNQNLGSMTQFVSFSQHPSDANTLLGGAQDNGSPATASSTTSTSWINVYGGDGGFNAIDQGAPLYWYVSNPDVPLGGLNILQCSSGVSCREGNFSAVVGSSDLGGDDGGFYFPYILDLQSRSALLVGTCRVWRGPRGGGVYADLSPNFDTLGTGTCTGSEVNSVRALAAGGPTDSNGSKVIYATTDGPGPMNARSPTGGHVWVTTNATAGAAAFTEVSQNINANQFPVSSVAIDPSDPSGGSALVTIMGFTGGTGHVWKTTDAGATWSDFTGTLPDAPVNAVVIDPASAIVYVGTDVGVYHSSMSAANWSEVGPSPGAGTSGFLPNVAVTGLAIFSAGGQRLLRASTYGRGIWQWSLAPDFQMAISNSPQTVVLGKTATFDGTVTAANGYNSPITLSCVSGTTSPPKTCTASPPALTATTNTPFTVAAGGYIGDYSFNIQGVGSDGNATTHQVPVVLHVITNKPDFVLGESGTFPTVNAGSTNTTGPITVTGINGFTGVVNLSCALVSGNGGCSVSPASIRAGPLPATANVTVDAANLSGGAYQFSVQGTSGSLAHPLIVAFNVADYQLSGDQGVTIAPGAQGSASLTITPLSSYSGNINVTCDATSLPGSGCTLNLANPIAVTNGTAVPLTATITVPGNAANGNYEMRVNTQDTSGAPAHSMNIGVTVSPDFMLSSSTGSQTVAAGQTTAPYNLTLQPVGTSFNGAVKLTCSGLPANAGCLFLPAAPVVPGTATQPVVMNISTADTTPPGNYLVTVTGTASSLTHSVTVSLTVTTAVAGGDFQLAVAQQFPASVDAGSAPNAKVTITPAYSGSVTASCDAGTLSGQCSITPGNPIAITAGVPVTITVTLNVPNSAAPNASNTYTVNLTVADASRQLSQTQQLSLTVIQDFSVNSATPGQSVTAGQTTGAYQLAVAPNPSGSSFPGAVTLSCDPKSLPAGAKCNFTPNPVIPANGGPGVVMTISTAATHSMTWPYGRPRTFYAMWLMLPGFVIVWGRSHSRLRRKQRIACTLTGLILTALTLASCGGGTASSGGAGTQPGSPIIYSVTIEGVSGNISHTAAVNLTVQ